VCSLDATGGILSIFQEPQQHWDKGEAAVAHAEDAFLSSNHIFFKSQKCHTYFLTK
jgi:hypothetical protein